MSRGRIRVRIEFLPDDRRIVALMVCAMSDFFDDTLLISRCLTDVSALPGKEVQEEERRAVTA